MSTGPCMCGAPDCPSCGPAQGYEVVKVWRNGRYRWVNPEDDDYPSPDDKVAEAEEAADAEAERRKEQA